MTDVRGARIVRLLEDPAVTGDLLLVAVGLAAKYDFGLDYGGTLNGLAGLLWNRPTYWRIRMALKDDMRTYKPPRRGVGVCTAPMVRRPGPCGRNATNFGYLTDWSTGEMIPDGGCSRHWRLFDERHRANWAAKPDIPPLPCANHGGALVPHFERIDWRKFWRRLDPGWVEHPETKPWPKPDLTLVLGEAEGTDRDAPILSLLPSGGAS